LVVQYGAGVVQRAGDGGVDAGVAEAGAVRAVFSDCRKRTKKTKNTHCAIRAGDGGEDAAGVAEAVQCFRTVGSDQKTKNTLRVPCMCRRTPEGR